MLRNVRRLAPRDVKETAPMTNKEKREYRSLHVKLVNGEATADDVARFDELIELRRKETGFSKPEPTPVPRTIWDLPIARVMWEADQRQS